MAVVTTFSHKFFEEVVKKQHDVTTDTLKVALMDSSFVFDPDIHATWSDCAGGSSSGSGSGSGSGSSTGGEIAAGYGYTANGETLTTVAVAIDASGNQVDITADNVTWTASGGPIPETGSAVVYNDSHTNKTVVLGIDFGADYTTADGKSFQLNFSDGLAVINNA